VIDGVGFGPTDEPDWGAAGSGNRRRRRLRFAEWGIGRQQWLANTWNLWAVPLDPDYFSRREARGLAEGNDARRPGDPIPSYGSL
jgi:hypothetical protein